MSRKSWKKKDTWSVDHSLDLEPSGSSIGGSFGGSSGPPERDRDSVSSDVLETPAEKKARKRSLIIAYTTMFVMSIGFSIVLTGVWPYLQSLDPTKTKSSLGWVVAANPFGQMVAAPILGYWGNRAGTVRFAMIVSITCFIGGNVMYSLLHAFGEHAYAMMILSRFIVGVSSANVTLCRSYVAGATTVKERTIGLSIISASQALGFVVGPGIQAILTLLIDDTYTITPAFVIDRYTATGWAAACLGLINVVIVMPCIFQEYYIAAKEQKLIKKKTDTDMKLPKPDYFGVVGLLIAFFFVLFIYVLIETLAEPFVADQYALDDETAIVVSGLALMGGGTLSIIMYVITNVLSRKGYDERKIMLIMGFIPMMCGTILYMPFTNEPITMQNCTIVPDSTTAPPDNFNLYTLPMSPYYLSESFNDSVLFDADVTTPIPPGYHEECTPGCPKEQEWCKHVPALALGQCITAFFITVMGYPVFIALAQATFSKMLGPKPQGLWMGILTGVGSLSRITGPIFVSYVYTYYGTYVTFGIVLAGMVFSLCDLLFNFKRLVPMKVPTLKGMGRDNPAMAEEKV